MKHNNNTLFNTPSPRCLRTRPFLQGARKTTPRGFTLIELLVVVLIIGILAAVAVPQYKKAVVKSRLAAIKPVLTALKNAEETYHLANGEYTENLDLLDITHPCSQIGKDKTLLNCNKHFMIDVLGAITTNDSSAYLIHAAYCPDYTNNWTQCLANRDFSFLVYLAHHSTYPNITLCSGVTNFGKNVCKD